jgi:hypothetical protein
MGGRALALLLLLGCTLAAAAGAGAEESCVTCHPDVRTEYGQSVHAREFGCTACHGGDPAVVGLEAHGTPGWVGTPGRTAIPALCGSCHADAERMRPSGLPTDQYAQYRTSRHGQRLTEGDTRVAVCTDCHGAHGIAGAREPASPVAPRAVPATCGRCHADQSLMAAYGLPADPVEKFRASVHGRALLVDEHPRAPTCATCHGAHGTTAPHIGAISKTCGHCHSRTLGYFNEGPHGRAAREGKMSECIGCHGYHDTAPPDRALFDIACRGCHAAGDSAVATGERLKILLSRAGESLQTAADEMAAVQTVSPTVVRLRPRLQQAHAYLMEALPVQHALDLERVDDLTRAARSISEDVRAAVHGVREDLRMRWLGLGVAWIFILFTAAVAYLYRRERRGREER